MSKAGEQTPAAPPIASPPIAVPMRPPTDDSYQMGGLVLGGLVSGTILAIRNLTR